MHRQLLIRQANAKAVPPVYLTRTTRRAVQCTACHTD
ncbi:hypothetical protein PVAP13_6KG253200 [Panicum virgatum]|uniref:Uncharacterized protein n=1 Tax=Panicum virgatum TaxID=38727 RepID=A0A8T0RDF3_PANVG|nr:hypothetical protein PVAP13_6KG253200 [Panicum virgatum]